MTIEKTTWNVDIVSGKLELCHKELDIDIDIVDNPEYHGDGEYKGRYKYIE